MMRLSICSIYAILTCARLKNTEPDNLVLNIHFSELRLPGRQNLREPPTSILHTIRCCQRPYNVKSGNFLGYVNLINTPIYSLFIPSGAFGGPGTTVAPVWKFALVALPSGGAVEEHKRIFRVSKKGTPVVDIWLLQILAC